MPQLQNLVLTDRAATPVAHTFVPRDVVNNVGTVIETTGVHIGDRTFSISTRKTATGRYKVTVKAAFPIVVNETINGITVPTVSRVSHVDTTFTFDASSTEQERKDAVGMFQSAFDPSKVLVNDAVVKLEGVY